MLVLVMAVIQDLEVIQQVHIFTMISINMIQQMTVGLRWQTFLQKQELQALNFHTMERDIF